MKRHLKSIIAVISLVGLLVIIFLFLPLKKVKLPELKKDIDYNLLVITIDTLRADRLGCYGSGKAGTPNIDRLAEKGVMFENCYAPVPITLPSHCSIFTGREPVSHGVRNNGTYVLDKNEHTLAEFFQAKGYKTFAAVATFVLESKFGLNQGFDIYDDALDFKTVFKNFNSEIPADRVYGKFTNWLEKNYNNNFFSWVHFYDPHRPYAPPEKYREKFTNQPYLGEIAYVDHYIGKIIDDLKAKNLLNRTVIILAGDHGEAFGEHKEFGHTIFCYQENLKVPLIFYNPDVFPAKKIIDFPAKLTDIMPTVLHLFEMEIPAAVNGADLLPVIASKEKKHPPELIYFESMFGKENGNWAPLTGIIFDNYKYISLPQPELYDLTGDSSERKNLFLEKNRLAKEMDKKLQKYLLKHINSRESKGRQLSPMDKKKLETLGYISSFSKSTGKTIDPKEGIELLHGIARANDFIAKRKFDEAERRLNQIRAENPEIKITQLYDSLQSLYKEKKDHLKLEKTLKEAIADFPNMDVIKESLAELYSELGRTAEAEELCRDILQQNSLNTNANVILGRLYSKKGSFAQALPLYRKALELEPFNAHTRVEYAEVLFSSGKIDEVKIITKELMKNETFIDARDTLDLKTRMGVMLLNMKEYDQTITLCLQILSRGDKTPQVFNQLGQAYFKKGNFQEALQAYKNALDLDQENALTLSNMGTLYLTLFRMKKDRDFHTWAVEHYTRAVKSNPRMVTALNGLAVAYSFAGNRSKAIGYWEKTIAADPSFTQVYFNLAITYLKIGKKKNALKYLNQCKNNYYSRLSITEQNQLDQLIGEAMAE